jgi:hypothetical protein
MRTSAAIFLVFVCSLSARAQEPGSPAADLRSQTHRQRYLPELPRSSSVAPTRPDSTAEALLSARRSLRPASPAELALEARVAVADRGYVERHRPATEQLALGLDADPPRPSYPLLATGPRSNGPPNSPYEQIQLPPLRNLAEERATLTGDPATIAARPLTAPRITASRGPAPVRNDLVPPDPLAIGEEIKIGDLPPDADPPAAVFSVPIRPTLPVAPEE